MTFLLYKIENVCMHDKMKTEVRCFIIGTKLIYWLYSQSTVVISHFIRTAFVLEMKGQGWLEAFVKSTTFALPSVGLINVYQSSYEARQSVLAEVLRIN